MEKKKKNKEISIPVEEPVTALKPEQKPSPIILDPDEEKDVDTLTEQAQALMFDFLKELENDSKGTVDLEKLKTIIDKIKKLKEEHKDNEEYQKIVKEYIDCMGTQLSAFVKEAPKTADEEELKALLHSLFQNKVPVSVDLSGINIAKITELYEKLQEAIKSGDDKKVTVARGRLIRFLKKEQNNISLAFGDIETIAQIGFELSKDNASIDKIKIILQKEENKNLYLYFKEYLVDLETFINHFQKVLEDEDIQRLFFLINILPDQLKEHRENLDSRFSKEFLEKKSRLTSIFTELPNAISLAIQKVNNSINELKESKTERRKLVQIKQVMTDVGKLIGTPVIFTGKYVMSNWYTLYMAYQTLTNSIEEAEREKREKAEAEEKARREAEEQAKREAEAKAKAEAEAKAKAEAEEKARLEAEEKARLEAEEQARLEAEAKAKAEAEEKARLEAEEKARLEAEEQARLEAEAKAKAEAEAKAKAEAEAKAKAEAEKKAQEEKNNEPDPTPTPNKYEHLKGSSMISIIVNLSFGGDLYQQLKYGNATPDSVATIHYLPPGAQWWEIWKIQCGHFTLREAQEIFGWWADVDLDQWVEENCITK